VPKPRIDHHKSTASSPESRPKPVDPVGKGNLVPPLDSQHARSKVTGMTLGDLLEMIKLWRTPLTRAYETKPATVVDNASLNRLFSELLDSPTPVLWKAIWQAIARKTHTDPSGAQGYAFCTAMLAIVDPGVATAATVDAIIQELREVFDAFQQWVRQAGGAGPTFS